MRTSDRLSAPERVVAVVAIAASVGGITALGTVLSGLPATLPVPVLMVQHLDASRPSSLATILATRTDMSVTQPTNGQRLEAGTAYIAPPDRNLEVGSDGTVRLREGPASEHRPRADALFRSVAAAYRAQTLAVVLTGTGSDGADGIRAVSDAGGHVITQDPSSAQASGMPSAAAATGLVDAAFPLDAIADEILRRVQDGRR